MSNQSKSGQDPTAPQDSTEVSDEQLEKVSGGLVTETGMPALAYAPRTSLGSKMLGGPDTKLLVPVPDDG